MGQYHANARAKRLAMALALGLAAAGCSTLARAPDSEKNAASSAPTVDATIQDRESDHNSRIVNRELQCFLKH